MASIPLTGPGRHIVWNNMAEARTHSYGRNMAPAQTYYWFYQKVRNGGPWDYKQKNRAWAEFGNFNYGATGTAAGIPENILLIAAGAAQLAANTSNTEKWGYFWQGPPYGDDPEDQRAIREGIRYARQHGF